MGRKKKSSSSSGQAIIGIIIIGFVVYFFSSGKSENEKQEAHNKHQIELEKRLTAQKIPFAKPGKQIITLKNIDLCASYGFSGSCMKNLNNNYGTIPKNTSLKVEELGLETSFGNVLHYKVSYKGKTGWIFASDTNVK